MNDLVSFAGYILSFVVSICSVVQEHWNLVKMTLINSMVHYYHRWDVVRFSHYDESSPIDGHRTSHSICDFVLADDLYETERPSMQKNIALFFSALRFCVPI